MLDRPARLEDYALLGDCQTAALVSRQGSIDWWCVPRFDSPACFAALLGSPDHGRFLIAPTGSVQSSHRYRTDTMVLETEHDTDTGRVRVVDCLAIGRDRPVLVRIVEGISGEVHMAMELVVRFDYGSIVPWVRRLDGAWQAVAGPDGLELHTPVDLVGENLRTTAEFTVRRRDRVPFVLGWFPSHDRQPVPTGAAQLVARTAKHWKSWSSRFDYNGQWRDPVMRSLLTLEALTYRPTGGTVAAPTTSLPETLGGTRNWDYRFCWVHDATLTLEALIAGGYREEAARWREWLLRAAAGRPEELQTMYGVAGERRLTEIELDWLPGYGGAKPVRTGNATHEQLQLDVYGELADVLWQGVRADMMLSEESWSLLRLLLRSLESRWSEPDEGIWEVRGPRRHFTHSKVMCWVAFDRAVAIAEAMEFDGPLDAWRATRDEIHQQVCDHAFNAQIGAFTQTYDSTDLDAAVLMIPLVGFLPATDPRVESTIAAIQRDVRAGGLADHGFVMRYVPTHEAVDGIGEREGVFLPCSFWMVEALALAGRTDEAHALFERLLAIANDVGLYAEEYDPEAPRLLGNFPQAFTHLALVGAAHTLEPGTFAISRRRRDPRTTRRPFADLDRPALPPALPSCLVISNIVQGSGSNRLALLIHGFGADERDLGGLVSYLDPDGSLAVVLPRGKFPVPGSAGYSWYGMFPDDEGQGTYAEALAELDDLLTEQAAALGLPREESIVAGFSQGAGLALGLALQRSDRPRPKAALAMSPTLDTAAFDLDETDAPPVLVQHGTNDPLIPVKRARELARQLRALGVPTVYREYPMEHQVALESLRDATDWLAQVYAGERPDEPVPDDPVELVPSVTTAQWDAEVLQSPLPVIVDFWAPWCGPCKQVSPVVETIAAMRKGLYKVVKVNIDEEPKLAEEYGVQSIPMIGLIRNGRLERASVGAKARPQLEAELGMLVIP